MKEELLKIYHEIFGADAPEPPEHLLPVIISMIESGEMERVLEEHDEIHKLANELESIPLDKKNEFWKPINERKKTRT